MSILSLKAIHPHATLKSLLNNCCRC